MESKVKCPHSISRTCLAQEFGLVLGYLLKSGRKGNDARYGLLPPLYFSYIPEEEVYSKETNKSYQIIISRSFNVFSFIH